MMMLVGVRDEAKSGHLQMRKITTPEETIRAENLCEFLCEPDLRVPRTKSARDCLIDLWKLLGFHC